LAVTGMTEPSTRRLARADRREQLLDTALAIVREEGTDALTLGHLAERAGVSKPIAYEHFKTRAGLLMDLYEQLDQRHAAALQRALTQTRPRLADVARVASAAYLDCYETLGPEWLAISAALQGADETGAFQQKTLDANVALYRQAFADYTQRSAEELRVLCVALIGAAEALTRELGHGRITRAGAAEVLSGLIVRALKK
jgi:AcrR family transcriptional regulator